LIGMKMRLLWWSWWAEWNCLDGIWRY